MNTVITEDHCGCYAGSAAPCRCVITPEQVKELFLYDESTGLLTRRCDKGRAKTGDAVGTSVRGGYLSVKVNGEVILVHRLIWLYVYGEWPNGQIDHINHDTADNRISNLRCVSNKQNCKNQGIGKNNTSGVLGVSWHKSINKWLATIKVNYKAIHIGSFDSFDDAVEARKLAEIKYDFHENHGVKTCR